MATSNPEADATPAAGEDHRVDLPIGGPRFGSVHDRYGTQQMSWQPEPRPEWIRAVNAGEVLPIAQEAEAPLDRAVLMAEAQATLGLADTQADWGSDDFVEPLDVVLGQLEDHASLSVFGRWFTRRFLLRLLEVRLQLAHYTRHDPGVAEEVIVEPVFVVGAPRTGTTVTHRLLAADPRRRAPLGWELLRPVPPPTAEGAPSDPRVELADRELTLPQAVTSRLQSIHRYQGRMRKECLSAMSFAFRSEEFISRYHVPGYIDWLQACDMTAAYEWHRRVLQVLQRRMPGTRWVLKSPVHLHNLPTLLAVYPDARLVFTHRDPLTVLSSVTSLVATLRSAFSDDVDVASIGRYHADLYGRSLDALVDMIEGGLLPAHRVAHIDHRGLLADPVGAIATAYQQMGLELTDQARAAIGAEVDLGDSGAETPHDYPLDGWGFDPARCRDQLARYCDQFDIEVSR